MWFNIALVCLVVAPQVISKEQNGVEDRLAEVQDANPKDFPCQISYRNDGGRLCGGCIVSENFIITSADCAKHTNISTVVVRAGSSSHEDGTVIPIANITYHPDYQTTNNPTEYDIACMKTTTSIPFSDTIGPVNLTDDYRHITGKINVSGFYLGTGEDSETSDKLKYGEMEVLQDWQCLNLWGELYNGDDKFCAGDYDDQEDTDICQGDSGDPALQNGELVGICSFSGRCRRYGASVVFCNLRSSKIREFIYDCTDGTII